MQCVSNKVLCKINQDVILQFFYIFFNEQQICIGFLVDNRILFRIERLFTTVPATDLKNVDEIILIEPMIPSQIHKKNPRTLEL